MDKRITKRNRASTVGKIKKLMFNLCREDLLEIQRAIEDLLPSAPPAPPEEKLTTPGVWLDAPGNKEGSKGIGSAVNQ